MLYAQLRDNSQGVIKITTGAAARDPAASAVETEHETKLSGELTSDESSRSSAAHAPAAQLHGRLNSGAVVVARAAALAAEKAAAHGFGLVGTHGTASSSMALGYFARQLAQRGLVALLLAQSPEYVAPHGAAQAVFGTNPIAVGIPTGEGGAPLVLDMATSAHSWWGVMEAADTGQPLPPGVAQDSAGRPTSDASAVLAGGALLPFDGGHKGSSLGLLVELLAGCWVGAAVSDKLAQRNWGNLVVAIDPQLLGPPAGFAQRVEAMLQRVKTAPRLPGVDEIRLPGERGDKLTAERLASGVLPLEQSLWASLQAIAARCPPGVGPPPPHVRGVCVRRAERDAPRPLRLSTRLVHPSGESGDPHRAASPPLYQTATFEQPDAVSFGQCVSSACLPRSLLSHLTPPRYDYTRSGNPTRALLERQLAELDGAQRAFAFTSGMAALSALCRLAPAGCRVLSGDDIYGGTSRLLAQVLPGLGVAVTNVDMTDLQAVAGAAEAGLRNMPC